MYGELDEELYMKQPEGFVIKGQEHKVLRLLKALYGLKQASNSWWKALTKALSQFGFKRTQSDAGIFIFREGNKLVIAIIYVDDILLCGSHRDLVLKKKAEFMKQWECRDLGEAREFLGMRIRRQGQRISIDQQSYLQKVLQSVGMTNAKPAPTPLPAGYQPEPAKSPATPQLRQRYQSMVGSLLYLMIGTRPDIAFAVTKMAQFAANPSEDHLDRLKYICRYLVGSQDYCITYNGASNKGLIHFTDSDWAADVIKRRSVTGYFGKIADGTISWVSHAQKTVALSSTEAEYMALSDCSRQVMWIKSLFSELGFMLEPLPICGDNQGSIFIASNPIQERRTKHIDIRYHFIRQKVEEGEVELFFVPGNTNPADLLTKNLGHVKFLLFRPLLGLTINTPKKSAKRTELHLARGSVKRR